MITKTNRNKSSFRIKTLEILNFGGYHLRPTRLALNSDGVVFSGPNGAGKSTFLKIFAHFFRFHSTEKNTVPVMGRFFFAGHGLRRWLKKKKSDRTLCRAPSLPAAAHQDRG